MTVSVPIRAVRSRGATSLQILVLLVPVMLGLMGFAVDLGRLYLVRGELSQAAEQMAVAAASKLNGTEAATGAATTAAQVIIAETGGNKYNFGSLVIGQSTGFLNSEAPTPQFYDTAAAAIGDDSSATGAEASGSTAKYVRVDVSAEAPLLFWGLLSLGQDRKTTVIARGVAGMSPPLCTACGIEPFAIAALSADDTVDFGFTVGTKYTLGFTCNGNPPPTPLAGSTQRIPYLIVNRFNDQLSLDETQQLYRTGAQGLLPSTTAANSCMSINAQEVGWVSAAPVNCSTNTVPQSVQAALCGLSSRFDTVPAGICSLVADVETLALSYTPDTNILDLDDYTAYDGNNRRLITIPIVDVLSQAGPMTILGFRQFLLLPNPNDTTIQPADANGRFGAMYIGSVAPVKQGRFDGCSISSGPGKVVMHR